MCDRVILCLCICIHHFMFDFFIPGIFACNRDVNLLLKSVISLFLF